VTDATVHSADFAEPKCVLLAPYSVMGWLYRPLVPALRRRFGTRFVFLLPESMAAASPFGDLIAPDDRVVTIPSFEDMARRNEAVDAGRVFEIARRFETKYSTNYTLDILQQERSVAFAFVDGAAAFAPDTAGRIGREGLAAAANGFFRLFETLFEEEPIDLVLAWPRSGAEAVLGRVATARGVLVTYPYTAKHRMYAYWANGAYAGGAQHRIAFARTPETPPIPAADIRPPARPADLEQSRMASRYGPVGSVRRAAMLVVHHAEFLVEDLRAGRPIGTNRRGLRAGLAEILHEFRYFRRFDALCEKDLASLVAAPFVFFAFQNEPEFSVQARCKEFNDQRSIVRQIAMSLPSGYRLVIKEHAWVGMRRLAFYEDLLAIPNVVMAHPGLRAIDLIPAASAVASLAGTVTIEAALHGKTALIFSGRSEFADMPHVRLVKEMSALPSILAECVAERPDAERLAIRSSAARFLRAVESISFEARPFYTKEAVDVAESSIERAVELLLDLLKLHRTEPALDAPR
jgi:hypothetical protein